MKNTQQLSTLTLAVGESQQPGSHGARGHASAGGPVGALLTMIVGLAIAVIAWRRQQR